jgi:glycine reductase
LLGSPDPDSAEIFADTVVNGDPTYAGALAGVSLGLPVFHVLEPEVRAAASGSIYDSQVGLMEGVLESKLIIEAVRRVRNMH